MKRITGRNMYKIAMVSMMALLLAGTSVSTASAGGRTNRAVTSEKGGGAVADTLQRETKMGLKPFTNIDIAVELADVTFLTAADYGIEMSWCDERLKPDYQVKDGKLSVFTRQHGSLGLQRAIGGQVIIYLPETAVLDQVSVKTDLGGIQIADRNITSMQAYCDAGEILLNRVSMQTLKVDTDLGAVQVLDSKVSRSTSVRGDAGDILLCGNIQGTVTIDNALGDVRMETTAKADTYQYDLTVDLGEIYVDGTEYREHCARQGGSSKLKVRVDAGDINVIFAGSNALDPGAVKTDIPYKAYIPYGLSYVVSSRELYYYGEPVRGFIDRTASGSGSKDRYYNRGVDSDVFLQAKYDQGKLSGVEEMSEKQIKEVFGSAEGK
ncbi:DUF4097 family beta strand repeat-containing protein [uncultured Clostridium sp.]|uniref:DUF4097 family beta strand repeat-containing protein n=1 Tax=uncultured Clostridium sp. TaxID=59620 RepID=UPI0025F251A9|nr:DUF4097 family beta strand repeat-containing protein [uncultured Clostridium sp.]